jgi:phosphinothricin acetyltransferase
MGGIEIRPAEAADLPRLVAIYNHYVRETAITFDIEPVTLEQRAVWLAQYSDSGRHRLLVAEEAGSVVAYAGSQQFRVKRAYESTVETTVYCAPDCTHRAIGSALYRALFAALRGEDIRSFIAGITLPNDASISMHGRFGFTHVGTMHAVGRKFGTYWDVAWYERLADG